VATRSMFAQRTIQVTDDNISNELDGKFTISHDPILAIELCSNIIG